MRISQHGMRILVLDNIAALAGFYETLQCLPDGSRPDVLRWSRQSGAVFVGDAKATESPGNRSTLERTSRYMKWFVRNYKKKGKSGVFALCVGGVGDPTSWALALELLAIQHGIERPHVGTREVWWDCFVTWLRISLKRPNGGLSKS